jgi:hypothetical protein
MLAPAKSSLELICRLLPKVNFGKGKGITKNIYPQAGTRTTIPRPLGRSKKCEKRQEECGGWILRTCLLHLSLTSTFVYLEHTDLSRVLRKIVWKQILFVLYVCENV